MAWRNSDQAFKDAIEKIAKLEAKVESLEEQIDNATS